MQKKQEKQESAFALLQALKRTVGRGKYSTDHASLTYLMLVELLGNAEGEITHKRGLLSTDIVKKLAFSLFENPKNKVPESLQIMLTTLIEEKEGTLSLDTKFPGWRALAEKTDYRDFMKTYRATMAKARDKNTDELSKVSFASGAIVRVVEGGLDKVAQAADHLIMPDSTLLVGLVESFEWTVLASIIEKLSAIEGVVSTAKETFKKAHPTFAGPKVVANPAANIPELKQAHLLNRQARELCQLYQIVQTEKAKRTADDLEKRVTNEAKKIPLMLDVGKYFDIIQAMSPLPEEVAFQLDALLTAWNTLSVADLVAFEQIDNKDNFFDFERVGENIKNRKYAYPAFFRSLRRLSVLLMQGASDNMTGLSDEAKNVWTQESKQAFMLFLTHLVGENESNLLMDETVAARLNRVIEKNGSKYGELEWIIKAYVDDWSANTPHGSQRNSFSQGVKGFVHRNLSRISTALNPSVSNQAATNPQEGEQQKTDLAARVKRDFDLALDTFLEKMGVTPTSIEYAQLRTLLEDEAIMLFEKQQAAFKEKKEYIAAFNISGGLLLDYLVSESKNPESKLGQDRAAALYGQYFSREVSAAIQQMRMVFLLRLGTVPFNRVSSRSFDEYVKNEYQQVKMAALIKAVYEDAKQAFDSSNLHAATLDQHFVMHLYRHTDLITETHSLVKRGDFFPHNGIDAHTMAALLIEAAETNQTIEAVLETYNTVANIDLTEISAQSKEMYEEWITFIRETKQSHSDINLMDCVTALLKEGTRGLNKRLDELKASKVAIEAVQTLYQTVAQSVAEKPLFSAKSNELNDEIKEKYALSFTEFFLAAASGHSSMKSDTKGEGYFSRAAIQKYFAKEDEDGSIRKEKFFIRTVKEAFVQAFSNELINLFESKTFGENLTAQAAQSAYQLYLKAKRTGRPILSIHVKAAGVFGSVLAELAAVHNAELVAAQEAEAATERVAVVEPVVVPNDAAPAGETVEAFNNEPAVPAVAAIVPPVDLLLDFSDAAPASAGSSGGAGQASASLLDIDFTMNVSPVLTPEKTPATIFGETLQALLDILTEDKAIQAKLEQAIKDVLTFNAQNPEKALSVSAFTGWFVLKYLPNEVKQVIYRRLYLSEVQTQWFALSVAHQAVIQTGTPLDKLQNNLFKNAKTVSSLQKIVKTESGIMQELLTKYGCTDEDSEVRYVAKQAEERRANIDAILKGILTADAYNEAKAVYENKAGQADGVQAMLVRNEVALASGGPSRFSTPPTVATQPNGNEYSVSASKEALVP